MQIDWEKALDDIFADKMSCPRCAGMNSSLVAGYSRSPATAEFAPRTHNCKNPSECDARRLVIVCEPCARELRLRASPVDREGMMNLLLIFAEEDQWRTQLEEEYLGYHRWFREHNTRIPNPGWRSEYVEEIVGLGYKTLLGN
jgi:hypothetical protein